MNLDEWTNNLSGVAGAIISMKFTPGTIVQKLTSAAGGIVAWFYATPYVVEHLSLPKPFAGFLVGLFGMVILSRVWDWVSKTSITEILTSVFTKGSK